MTANLLEGEVASQCAGVASADVETSKDAQASCALDAAEIPLAEDSRDIASFLKDLNANCKKKLQLLPEPDKSHRKDPMLAAAQQEKEQALLRQVWAKARMSAMDDKKIVYEADWREQVQRRKEAERRRVAEEEAAAQAALQAFLQAERTKEREKKENDNLLAVARQKWAANDLTLQKARVETASIHDKDVRAWLNDEWQPRLQSHREELRAQRLAEQQANDEECSRLQRERKAFSREDAASAAFVAFAVGECQRREALARCTQDAPTQAAVQAVLASAEIEQHYARECEARRQATEEAAARQEAEKRDRDYKEWKRQVRDARCRRKRVEDRTIPTSDLEERKRLELQGRDYFKERELTYQSVLEDALQRATSDSTRLKEFGLSPRSILEETRQRAAAEKHQRQNCEPAKAEQELWDALLAKNRHSRQQERTLRTPRWGVFA